MIPRTAKPYNDDDDGGGDGLEIGLNIFDCNYPNYDDPEGILK